MLEQKNESYRTFLWEYDAECVEGKDTTGASAVARSAHLVPVMGL